MLYKEISKGYYTKENHYTKLKLTSTQNNMYSSGQFSSKKDIVEWKKIQKCASD